MVNSSWNFLADTTLVWNQKSGESIVIEFDRNGEGIWRKRANSHMSQTHFLLTLFPSPKSITSVEIFFCTFGDNFLLMADRPQAITLSTQIITEICTNMYMVAIPPPKKRKRRKRKKRVRKTSKIWFRETKSFPNLLNFFNCQWGIRKV